VKDALEVAGVRSTGGAVELADHVPAADAPVVARLRAAGAVVLGKTNVPAWSGDIQTFNDLFGTTANPWDPSRTPGGSSGGPAVAVATGMSAFETGTDIGGSIRTPSGWCGVCGHKPTFGVVPQRGYLDHVAGGRTDADINVVGPIARSVRDLAMLLDVVAGPLPAEGRGWSLSLPPSGWAGDVAALRVGTWFGDAAAPVDPAVAEVLEAAASALAAAGAGVTDARPGFAMAEAAAVFSGLITAAVSVSFPDDGGFADAVSGSHRQWLRLDERRAALQAAWESFFDGHDVLLAPVMPVGAFPHDHSGDITTRTVDVAGVATPHVALITWAGIVGVAGLPSTVVPAGRVGGVPVGIQVVGRRFADRTTLAVAALLEELLGGYRPPPIAVG
ncbi:MAG TPA: amidase family protein, partial [Acidimicrobiales bacterium]|nr:amidase family protein [Acidimicrobiales bacterium]